MLHAGTIEERIFQRQVSKQGLSGTVVDLGKGAEHTSFSSSELRDLFSLTDTLCLTHDLLDCRCAMDGVIQGRLTHTHASDANNPAKWRCAQVLTYDCRFFPPIAAEEATEPASDRPCQLGRLGDRGGGGGGGGVQKPLSMSELMQWRHFSADATATFSDPYLDHARNHITFAFQSTLPHAAQ